MLQTLACVVFGGRYVHGEIFGRAIAFLEMRDGV
jgi:hypothetical protein